jgi:D-3-phosphoglycerate dehydrogenase / 2-oxoglutarate reductase
MLFPYQASTIAPFADGFLVGLPMTILFLRAKASLHHSYDDLLATLNGGHTVKVLDPAKPIQCQFENIDVVVDPGGAVGTREMIDAAHHAGVKLWQVTTNGLDHVDVAYFLEKKVPLANCPGPISAVPLAEHVLWCILSFAKNFRRNRIKEWDRSISEELTGKTLGIIGLGASGRELAKRAWPFCLRIVAIDVEPKPQSILRDLHVEFLGDLTDLHRVAAESDYLSLHVPLTSKTRHLIDGGVLSKMKPMSVLINVARGELVDEAALIEALQKRTIRGAALDVFATEPIDPEHPLLSLDNVMLTPHVAGFTTGTWRRRVDAAVDNISRVAAGMAPAYQVNSIE